MSSSIRLEVNGSPMPAYVAEPVGVARAGVIVVQEIFGVSQPMKDVADLLAADGYLAIVPAMFHREDPNFSAEADEAGMARGIAAAAATSLENATSDLSAAATYLRARLGTEAKVGAWGFCFGGSLAFFSTTLPFVDAAVSFYGGQIARSRTPAQPPLIERTPHVAVPLFLAFGGQDASITPEDVTAIRKALAATGKTFEFHVYPDVGHAFFRPGPESSESARDAWSRVRGFLSQRLAATATP